MNSGNDDSNDWLEDVRRWYHAGGAANATKSASARESVDAAMSIADEIGYEAAHPALQAKHWPDAPRSTVAGVL